MWAVSDVHVNSRENSDWVEVLSRTAYQDDALEVEETVCVAMKGLPPDEFEGVLHPVFEEDEIKLIVIGGCLGALVGLAQYLLIFSSS